MQDLTPPYVLSMCPVTCGVEGWPGVLNLRSGTRGVYQLPLVDGVYTLRLTDDRNGEEVIFRVDAVAGGGNRLLDLGLR